MATSRSFSQARTGLAGLITDAGTEDPVVYPSVRCRVSHSLGVGHQLFPPRAFLIHSGLPILLLVYSKLTIDPSL